MLVKRDWDAAPLDQLVPMALAPFLIHSKIRVEGGPDIVFPRQHISGLTMALYELATNSLKYGALSGDGDISVGWSCNATNCLLSWIETCGATAAPSRDGGGFGHRLIKATFGGAKGTSVAYELRHANVICRFSWPRSTVARPA